MKSFGITVAFVLAAVSAGVGALPVGGEALARRDGNFFIPWFASYTPANGAISASGANGGYNYGGNGANGGTISISRREEGFPFPCFVSHTGAGAISATGANGGSISSRGEEENGFFFWPSWPSFLWPSAPASDAVEVTGENGGTNSDGDGANGGTISVSSREDNAEQVIWPYYLTPIPGFGGNGGNIAINGRDEHIWPSPAWGGSQNSVSGSNSGWNSGQIGTMRGGGFQNSVSGVNSGFNSGTVGAMW